MSEAPSYKNDQDFTNSEGKDHSPYAGVMKRGIAHFIDLLLLVTPYILSLSFFSPTPFSFIFIAKYRPEYSAFIQSLPALLITYLLLFFYFTLQYRSKHQATLGMRLFDIKLTTEDSKKPSWPSLSLRYFLYILPTLALAFLLKSNVISSVSEGKAISLSGVTTVVVILMIALTNRKQTYYDMAAKTLVLQEPKEINPPFAYAGLSRRFFSNIVDLLISFPLIILIMASIESLPSNFLPTNISSAYQHSAIITIGTLFLLPLAYSIPQLCSKHQATLGMRLLNIKIMTTDYQKPSTKQLFSRYCLLFFIYPLSILELIPAAMILFTDRKQAYYDKMSKTIFVKTAT